MAAAQEPDADHATGPWTLKDNLGGQVTLLPPDDPNGVEIFTEIGYQGRPKGVDPFIDGLLSYAELQRRGLVRNRSQTSSNRIYQNADYNNYIYFRRPYYGELDIKKKVRFNNNDPSGIFKYYEMLLKDRNASDKTDEEYVVIKVDPYKTTYYSSPARCFDNRSTCRQILRDSQGLLSDFLFKGIGYWDTEQEIVVKTDRISPAWFVNKVPLVEDKKRTAARIERARPIWEEQARIKRLEQEQESKKQKERNQFRKSLPNNINTLKNMYKRMNNGKNNGKNTHKNIIQDKIDELIKEHERQMQRLPSTVTNLEELRKTLLAKQSRARTKKAEIQKEINWVDKKLKQIHEEFPNNMNSLRQIAMQLKAQTDVYRQSNTPIPMEFQEKMMRLRNKVKKVTRKNNKMT